MINNLKKEHYRLVVTFDFGIDAIEYDPEDIPEGEEALNYCLDPECVHDLIQCGLDDGIYDVNITAIPHLDK